MDNYKKLDRPIPARFVSGHFFFTLGKHCEEYLYDPDLYFAGDEISLSVKSFTSGYDLFHPHENVVWHEYTREYRKKHWGDHDNELKKKGEIELTWSERDTISKRRLRQLLKEEDNGIDLGKYGLGNVRTHHEYELYTGIDFKNRLLHNRAKQGIDPEIVSEKEWQDESSRLLNMKEWPIAMQWNVSEIPDDDYKFWYLGIEDKGGKVLFRKDFNKKEDSAVLSKKINNFTTIVHSSEKPDKWVLWLYSNTRGGWAERFEHAVS